MEPKTGTIHYTSGPHVKVNLGPLRTPSPELALQIGYAEINVQKCVCSLGGKFIMFVRERLLVKKKLQKIQKYKNKA